MQFGELSEVRFPARDAAGELRRHFVRLLRAQKPEPGSRLMTEPELMALTRLSRSTVRRALTPLEEEGWIDRRAGSGTFVGMRIGELLLGVKLGQPPLVWGAVTESKSLDAGPSEQIRVRRSRGLIRVAVLIYNIGDLAHDWYTPEILEGLDSSSGDKQVVIELLGDRQQDNDGDVDAISRRLELSRPDVLICLSNKPKHAFVIRDAQKLGIRCFVLGTPLSGLDIPGVSEDNRQILSTAARHLIERGHRRIGLSLPQLVEPWVFERLESYTTVLQNEGLSPCVHWTRNVIDEPSTNALERFIHENNLTALIPGNIDSMRQLDALVRAGRISVPNQLSVVSLQPDHEERCYLGIAKATRMEFPFREMGRHLAAMACAVVDQTSSEPLGFSLLPARLVIGQSVVSFQSDISLGGE